MCYKSRKPYPLQRCCLLHLHALTLCARTRNANITLYDVTTLSWAWATFECRVTIITSLLVNRGVRHGRIFFLYEVLELSRQNDEK